MQEKGELQLEDVATSALGRGMWAWGDVTQLGLQSRHQTQEAWNLGMDVSCGRHSQMTVLRALEVIMILPVVCSMNTHSVILVYKRKNDVPH